MTTGSSSIWILTRMRARSLSGVMSPKPTVEKTVTTKYNAPVWSSGSLKFAVEPRERDK